MHRRSFFAAFASLMVALGLKRPTGEIRAPAGTLSGHDPNGGEIVSFSESLVSVGHAPGTGKSWTFHCHVPVRAGDTIAIDPAAGAVIVNGVRHPFSAK